MPTFGAATGLQIGHYLQAAAHRRAPPRPEEVVCTSPYLKVLMMFINNCRRLT